ncbi:MAG TPA: FtsX-like permease family protein, partial [Rugosimonospora sp.]|nr:FtsX-like permease family protein [Rugosimonospora sp.]
LAASLVLFAATLPALAAARGDGPLWMIAGAVALLIAGIVAAGPWLTMVIGGLLVGVTGGAPGLLAGRRLAHNPTAGFRAISGLVLAVFLVTMASVATAIAITPVPVRGQELIPAHAVGRLFLFRGTTLPPAGRADALADRIRAMPGVTGLLDLRWATASAPTGGERALPAVTRCADLRATGLGGCTDPAALMSLDARLLGNGFVRDLQPAAAGADPRRLPMLGLLATTDGHLSTMERVRTAIEAAVPEAAWLPWTTEELKGQNTRQRDQLTRISDAVLLATLLIAGFSLAVSVAGGLVERKRPFALLRLAGTRPADLRRLLLAETAAPLVTVAVVSAGLGFAVISYVAWVSHAPLRAPDPSYWWILGTGLLAATGLSWGVTAPLMNRLTSLESARFE